MTVCRVMPLHVRSTGGSGNRRSSGRIFLNEGFTVRADSVSTSNASPATVARASKVAGVLQQCRRAFVLIFLLTTVTEILSIVPMLYMLNMYDRVLSSRSEVTLVSLTLLICGVYLFWTGLEWIQRRLMVRISLRIDWDLAENVYDTAFRRHLNRRQANIHQVLGDLVNLRQFLTGAPILALMSAPFAVLFILFSALFHPYLALFSLAASVLLLGITFWTQKVSTPMLRDANNASAEATRVAAQTLRHADTALALGMHDNLRQRWHERHLGCIGLQVGASETAGALGSFSGLLTKAMPSLQMALGIWLAIEGLITGGMVIAATFLISKTIGPIQKVLASWKEISNARQAYERLAELFAEDDDPADRMTLPPPVGRLSVSELVVQPAGAAKPVLSGVSFRLEPGQVAAIVGPSAAGKSSLVKSLVGIWRPASGSVRLDGAELFDWARNDLGRYIGYVPQEVEFFEATVAENIARLGEVDSDKVVKAAKLAGVHEVILAFPQGYDTRLGDTGFALTGGQKQRLALARALYGDPRYVVMDEPNASLDETGERSLVQAIRTLKANGTAVLFTTHRPELVNAADVLLVLAEGKQMSFGSVQEMLAAARKLRDTQQQAVQRPPQAGRNQASAAGPAAMTGAAA